MTSETKTKSNKVYVKYRDWTGKKKVDIFPSKEDADESFLREFGKAADEAGRMGNFTLGSNFNEYSINGQGAFYEWLFITYGEMDDYIESLDSREREVPKQIHKVKCGCLTIEEMDENTRRDYEDWLLTVGHRSW